MRHGRAELASPRPEETTAERRREYLDKWCRAQLLETLPDVMSNWKQRLDSMVPQWTVGRMKTKWGSFNRQSRHIWLNVEIAKKHPDCLEYIVVREMTYYLEGNHGDRFTGLMDGFMPDWRSRRDQLNDAPLAQEDWVQ